MLTRRNPERERNQLTIFHNGHVHASQKLRRWFIPVPREKFLTVHLHDFPHVVFAIVHNVHKHFKQSRHLLLQRSGPDGNERLGRSRRRFKNNYVRVKCDVSCYLSHLSLSPPPFVHRIPPPPGNVLDWRMNEVAASVSDRYLSSLSIQMEMVKREAMDPHKDEVRECLAYLIKNMPVSPCEKSTLCTPMLWWFRVILPSSLYLSLSRSLTHTHTHISTLALAFLTCMHTRHPIYYHLCVCLFDLSLLSLSSNFAIHSHVHAQLCCSLRH